MGRKKTKKGEMRELDNIWKNKVKVRDGFTCQVCKKKLEKKNCHAHHITPRQIKKCKWDINNGITLCYYHHKIGMFSAHQNAVWFTFWLKTNKPNQFMYVINALKKLDKNDLDISTKPLSNIVGRRKK